MLSAITTTKVDWRYENYVLKFNDKLRQISNEYPLSTQNRSSKVVEEVWKLLTFLPKYSGRWRKDRELLYYFITHQEKVARRAVLLYRAYLLLNFLGSRTGDSAEIITKSREIYDPARLHDIGKLKIRRSLISLKRLYNNQDKYEITSHTTEGRMIVCSLGLPKIFGDVCQWHHERWDGSGYHKLKGEEIPIEASIVAIADTLESIQSRFRKYHKSKDIKKDKACDLVRKEFEVGRFDPRLSSAFEYCAANYKEFSCE